MRACLEARLAWFVGAVALTAAACGGAISTTFTLFDVKSTGATVVTVYTKR